MSYRLVSLWNFPQMLELPLCVCVCACVCACVCVRVFGIVLPTVMVYNKLTEMANC